MPYINRFTFEIDNISGTEIDNKSIEYIKRRCNGFSWYSQTEDMIKISSRNPGKIFTINRQGEYSKDFDTEDYFNGEVIDRNLSEIEVEVFEPVLV